VAATSSEATALAEEFRLASNAGRILILAYLRDRGPANWTQLQTFLSAHMGPINPNTLQFHIKVLLSAKWVKRTGSDESPLYSIAAIPGGIAERLPQVVAPARSTR